MVSILHRSQHDFAVARCHGPQGSQMGNGVAHVGNTMYFPFHPFRCFILRGGGSRSSLWWAGIHEHSERDDGAQGVEQFDLESVDSFASNVSQHMFSSWCIEDPFMIKHDKPKVGSILCRESNLIQTPNIFILAAQTVPQIFVDGKIIPGWDLRCQRCQWCHALCEYWVSPDKKQKTTTSPRR